ncbi:MAG: hypothetical protein IKF05_06375 [Erysipelotrichaceae bacterium]|nr:hypothetical protein [Erysipelotrichaceae bacterium]
MINKFKEIHGKSITKIPGQNRLAYAFSDYADLYDLTEWAAVGGYQGSVIYFYDFETGDVVQPFPKKRNVAYGKPVFSDNAYYYLKADYDEKEVVLYKYLPGEESEVVTALDLNKVDLYNLTIMGEGVNIVSQSDTFTSYYPKRYSFKLRDNETVTMINGDQIYAEAWIEEGWDHQNNRASENYNYYNVISVKNPDGRTIYEGKGCLFQNDDGSWWVS